MFNYFAFQWNSMAENAPANIGKPYVVIVTPTRELCTQVRAGQMTSFRSPQKFITKFDWLS